MPDDFEPILGNAPSGGTGDNAGSQDNSGGQGNEPPLGGNGANQGGFDNGSTSDFLSHLSEDEKKFAASKGWKSPTDFVNGYRELNKRFSGGLQPEVGDNGDLTPEQWDEFGKRIGAPEKAEFYEFQRPDIPENVHYDADLENIFKEAVHSVRGTKAQANGIYKKVAKYLVDRQLEGAQSVRENMNNAYRELTNEYGGPDSPSLKDAMQQAFRSIKSTPGLLEAYQRMGVLIPAGEHGQYHFTDASIIRHHINSGSALYSESDGLSDIDGSTADKNPWVKGQENITAQGRIVKENPQLAARLMRQAGADPSEYGL